MYKLVVFVPDEAKESLKEALFAEGAGAQGAYSHCSWECLGVGLLRQLIKPTNWFHWYDRAG